MENVAVAESAISILLLSGARRGIVPVAGWPGRCAGQNERKRPMHEKCRTCVLTALSLIIFYQLALGQTAPATILDVELANFVVYFGDVTDYSRLATDPNRTTVTQPRNFSRAIGIADIVSVNGNPAKGVMTEQRTQFNLRVNPTPGQAIADA